jgi:hypothetical protein
MNGKQKSSFSEKSDNHKSISKRELGNKSDSISSSVTGMRKLRPAGLEPAASGLGNQRSIQLSYERSRYKKGF